MKITRTRVSITFLAIALLCPSAFPQSPHINTLSQGSGVTGTSVTINGTNFGQTMGSSTVTFNNVLASNPVWSSSTITVAVPSAATTGNVVVTVLGVASNGVQFTVLPQVVSTIPTSGPVGVPLEVYGTGFGNTTGSLTVGSVAATPTFWSDTKVNCEVPATATTGPVMITAGGNNSNNNVIFTLAVNGSISGTVSNAVTGGSISGAMVSLYLTGRLQTSTTSGTGGAYSLTNLSPGEYSLVISATGFSTANIAAVPVYAGGVTTENIALQTPNIAMLAPSSGPVGTVVVISGSSFGVSQGTVTFHGTTATPILWSNSTITVPVPAGATTGAVVVTVGGSASNNVTFTVGAGKIAGTITQSSNGSVVSGASIKAYQLGVLKKSTTSASNGTYTMAALTPGNFDVWVSATSLATTIAPAIPVTASTTTTQNFTLSSTPGGISGTVTQSSGGAAVPGATVNALQGYTVAATATTTVSGGYTLGSLAAGTYVVNVTATGFITQTNTGVIVTTGSTATANFSLPTQDGITYVYDQASRLAGVVDALGHTAVYNYDTAGNIQSISQNASSAISIIDFAPTSGIITTPVTMNGTGFSATKANDQVKFNGKAATVTSATTTQIVAKVPSGATSGTITVTSPAGTATSNSSFTVQSSNGLPTITSFTPPIATPGQPVSIVGTNFDPVASNDSITVNLNKTFATSATLTNITTAIPGIITTGHITVTTTLGASLPTSGYLFITPPGYTVAQVGYTGQTTLGNSATVTLGTVNQIGLLAVDVSPSIGLWIKAANNFPSSVPYTIYDPYGNIIGSGNIPTGSSIVTTSQLITSAGTSVIMVAPGNQTGNVVLTPNSNQGLMAEWQMANGIGTIVNDLCCGDNLTITPGGGGWTTQTGLAEGAYRFDGSATHMDAANSTQLNLNYNQPFSIALWVDATSTASPGGVEALFDRRNSSSGYQGYSVYFGYDNWFFPGWYMYFQLNSVYGSNYIEIEFSNSAGQFTTNTLHSLVFTYDGSGSAAGVTCYEDGTVCYVIRTIGSTVNASTQNSIVPRVGTTATGTAYPFTGNIGPIYVWDCALRQFDASNLASNPYSPPAYCY
jgi:YD repeat-containing protein